MEIIVATNGNGRCKRTTTTEIRKSQQLKTKENAK